MIDRDPISGESAVELFWQIIASELAAGHIQSRTSEQMRVLNIGATFFGWQYEMLREFTPGRIDCSTLTSQCFWEGAGILIPFLADSQRTAWVGEHVKQGDITPADVVIKYPARSASPDGVHNHVGIYLGAHQGTKWVLEARPIDGVVISRLSDFRADGGTRRFLIEPGHCLESVRYEQIRRWLQRVSKQGRLGAKNIAGRENTCFKILMKSGESVLAPSHGHLECYKTQRGHYLRLVGDTGIWHFLSASSPNIDKKTIEKNEELFTFGSVDVVEIGLRTIDAPPKTEFALQDGDGVWRNWIYETIRRGDDLPFTSSKEQTNA